MIGNPKWFNVRKYGGWGLTPNCIQGWLYLLLVVVPIIFLQAIPDIDGDLQVRIMLVWSILMALDFIDIMFRVKRDEREASHEAIAERNAAWFMVASLAFGVAYESAQSAVNGQYQVDPVILIALFGGLLIKAATHFYLRDK